MSEPNLISPLLDNFIVGEPFSSRSGVRSCPAIDKLTEDKYIVKIISTPASSTQMEAMLLSGAFADKDAALKYFSELARGVEDEVSILRKLSQLEGFLPVTDTQTVVCEDASGYETYLLSPYRKTLERRMRQTQLTHLAAINLGLDICSALAVCRRSGYLYVSLKPENIVITDEGTYKISDIGFIALDSLQYASLPDRCRSQYTAPEIADAYSSLNTTIDVYALGLILYRIFNGGSLPTPDALQQLPAPDYADYEMSEIILKACASDPADRWQDPVAFGQALIAYMQRNGAHDAPIIPVVPDPDKESEADTPDDAATQDVETESILSEETQSTEEEPSETEEIVSAEVETETPTTNDTPVYTEDSSGNLTFLSEDELPTEEELAQLEYSDVTEEVSEILNQADELISHEAPAPVVPPEPIDVPIPEPLPMDPPVETEEVPEDATEDKTPAEDQNITVEETEPATEDDSVEEIVEEQSDIEEDEPQQKKKSHWLRNILLTLLALGILAAGYFLYKNYYLQPIDGLRIQGSEDTLLVYVASELDETSLSVICSDIYGNQLTESVVNGKAVFKGLAPNSAYTINVKMQGFHKLTGHTTDTYTTPTRTDIVQLTAVAGAEDGSVILGFTIEGQDSDQWRVTYSTPGEPTKSTEFTGHIATINGLTIGNEYAFRLEPVTKMYFTGDNVINFTACTLVRAEDLRVTGCLNGALTVAWSAPENVSVPSWTVHCFNEKGYDKTMVVDGETTAFSDVTDTDSYTVEVTAAGMSISQRVVVESNSVTVLNFNADESAPNHLTITWDQPAQTAQESFILQYSVDGASAQEIACTENTATIPIKVPGSTYHFQLKTADGRSVLGGNEKFATAAAPEFDGYGVNYSKLQFMMCKTPSYADWNRYYLDDSDYTTSFSVGEKASFLVRIHSEYDTSWDEITTLYVIRNAEGKVVSTQTDVSSWTYMWYRNYGEFDIPSLPGAPGDYSITIYFNGALAGQTEFTVYD